MVMVTSMFIALVFSLRLAREHQRSNLFLALYEFKCKNCIYRTTPDKKEEIYQNATTLEGN